MNKPVCFENPMIYLVNLRKYNEGIENYGDWIEVSEDLEKFMKACNKIIRDENGEMDDYAIHDHDGFEGMTVSEYANLEEIARLAEFIRTCEYPMDLVCGVMDYLSFTETQDALDYIEDNFGGEWSTLEEWADDWLESTGSYGEMDKTLRNYFDLERYARDLELGGDVFTLPSNRGIYVLINS